MTGVQTCALPIYVETLEFFIERVGPLSKTREDVKTWFDYLDLDDHVTFGGKA